MSKPAIVYPLIDFIDEEMTYRGWTSDDLLQRAPVWCDGVDLVALEFIDAMRPSHGATQCEFKWKKRQCKMLGAIFGTSDGFWWRLAQISGEADHD